MKIKFIYPYWGSGHLSAECFLDRVCRAGYDGIEVNVPDGSSEGERLRELCRQKNLVFIAQQWLPPALESAENYQERVEDNLHRLAHLEPAFINSHTGKDYYSFNENLAIIRCTEEFSKSSSIPVYHETHRGRFAFHAFGTLQYLKEFPDLKLTGDLSHWFVVSESLLDDQQEIVDQIVPAISYLHARIGYEQCAQVNDARAPEWMSTICKHFLLWDQIIEYQVSQANPVFYICTEFGPSPYLSSYPFTQVPMNDPWDLNFWMKDLLTKRYRQLDLC